MKRLRCLALVIGINEYHTDKWKPLSYAIKDAEAVASKFAELRYEVEKYTNITSKDLVDIKDNILAKIYQKYDAFIFFFAGHGTIANASDCLLLSDVEDKEETRIKLRSIVIDDFLNELRQAGDQVNIFIIDACRAYYDNMSRGSLTISDFGKNVNLPYQSFIAFGSSPGQNTKESSKVEHGLFTDSLLRHIDEPNLNIETLFKEVRQDLYKRRGDQLPWDYSCLVNDFCFNYGQNDPYFDLEYSQDAYEDGKYISRNSMVNDILILFKSHNWDNEESALTKVHLNYKDFVKDDLFVLGRNILQAADGGCFVCEEEINPQKLAKYSTPTGENHILNGILYEIYFNNENKLRTQLKYTYGLLDIEKLSISKKFKKSFLFIRQSLKGYDVNYIPGETTKQVVNITSELDPNNSDIVNIKSIKYNGIDIIRKISPYEENLSNNKLEEKLLDTIGIPNNLLKINFTSQEHKNAEIYHIGGDVSEYDIF